VAEGRIRLGRAVQLRWGRALSWALYDFANTIYSAIVVSFAIALHVKEFTGVERYTFAVSAASMAASGLFVPFAGELSDRTGHAKGYLLALTLVCCACCAAIGAAPWAPLILLLYFVANFSYNASLTFYDSLLPVVAPPDHAGRVSGLGVGMGYAGVAVALPLAMLARELYRRTNPAHELAVLFPLAGALFLLGSIPLFLFVPGRPGRRRAASRTGLGRLALRRTLLTLRLLPRHRSVLFFLLGNFFCVDAVNATIFGYAPYLANVFGLGRRAIMLWLIPFSLCAFALGVAGGRLSDRFGARPTMMAACGCFMAATLVCGLTRSLAVFFTAFILLGGFGLSNVWVAGRKLLLTLVPAGQVGKYFGLYNVGHKLSMMGMVLFGILADLRIGGSAAGGYRAGLLVQLVSMGVGLALIGSVGVPGARGAARGQGGRG